MFDFLFFIFYFILIVSLAERKRFFFFGKENRYEMGGHHGFFLLKIPKMEGTTVKNSKNGRDHCKKTQKMKGMSSDFCYKNRKNRNTPLFKGHIYFKLGD